MADIATEAPETTAPETTPETTTVPKPVRHTGPIARRDARARMHERHTGTLDELIGEAKPPKAEEAATAEIAPETPPPEDKPEATTTETTETTTETTEQPAGETPEETPDEPETTETPDAEKPPEKPPEPPELVKVDIQADHPIRTSMGVDPFFEVATENQARSLRGLLNGTYARLKEVADLTAERDKFQDENARLQADKAAEAKWKSDPRAAAIDTQYAEILESHGQEAADQYRRGADVERDKLADEEYAGRMKVVQEQRATQAGEAWAVDSWHRATERIPDFVRNIPTYNELFGKAIKSFDKELELDQVEDPGTGAKLKVGDQEGMHRAFSNFFANRLSGQKPVIDAYRQHNAESDKKTAAAKAVEQNRQRQEDRAEGVKSFKQEAAKKREDAPPHPLGAVQSVDRGTLETDGDEAKANVTTNVHELRKQKRLSARDRVAKFFPS